MSLLLDQKSLKKAFSITGVLNHSPPLLLAMMKGNREEEELLRETHRQDNDAMVDAVVMAEVIFWMFL
jgi:hypothetical protein